MSFEIVHLVHGLSFPIPITSRVADLLQSALTYLGRQPGVFATEYRFYLSLHSINLGVRALDLSICAWASQVLLCSLPYRRVNEPLLMTYHVVYDFRLHLKQHRDHHMPTKPLSIVASLILNSFRFFGHTVAPSILFRVAVLDYNAVANNLFLSFYLQCCAVKYNNSSLDTVPANAPIFSDSSIKSRTPVLFDSQDCLSLNVLVSLNFSSGLHANAVKKNYALNPV